MVIGGRRLPFLRWSFVRMGLGLKHLTTHWQVGDGREEALADHVLDDRLGSGHPDAPALAARVEHRVAGQPVRDSGEVTAADRIVQQRCESIGRHRAIVAGSAGAEGLPGLAPADRS